MSRPIYQFKPTEADRAAHPWLPYGTRLRVVTPSGQTGGQSLVRVKNLSGQILGVVSVQSLEVLR